MACACLAIHDSMHDVPCTMVAPTAFYAARSAYCVSCRQERQCASYMQSIYIKHQAAAMKDPRPWSRGHECQKRPQRKSETDSFITSSTKDGRCGLGVHMVDIAAHALTAFPWDSWPDWRSPDVGWTWMCKPHCFYGRSAAGGSTLPSRCGRRRERD
jgi:hypothetical protein